MSTAERLMRYCRYDTQSDPDSGTHPSSEKQFVLAEQLVQELKVLGLEDAAVDEHCYVYAQLPANTETSCPTIGLIAHMDTAPAFSGKDIGKFVLKVVYEC